MTGPGAQLGRARARHATAVLVVLSLWAAGGCAATGRTGAGAGKATGDRALEVYVVGEGRSYARYKLERNGTLRFAGGADALADRYSWSGPMPDAEIDQLFALVDEHGWAESDPASVADGSGRTYTIRLYGPGLHRHFTVVGDSPEVTPVVKVLESAAARRNEAFLESLPQPGDQP